ncbi:MAG: M3 family oligoendopeptidase [Ardenticatenales bacterium]|nr:M3 family oligoendopeptidase [Ardenticatenales bacterium]
MTSLPTTASDILVVRWSDLEPFYQTLETQALTEENVAQWLKAWTAVSEVVEEAEARCFIATTLDAQDKEAQQRYQTFLSVTQPAIHAAEQQLKQRLLNSGLVPSGFELPLRNMRAEAALFREANLPLQAESRTLAAEYMRLLGAQSIPWEGEELPITHVPLLCQAPDRSRREQAWRAGAARQLTDREAINTLWGRAMPLRAQMAHNADLPDYRAYRWQQLFRFGYTPDDCKDFYQAVEEIALPAATRLCEKRRQQLGVTELYPWDMAVDPLQRPPLRPFQNVNELEDRVATIIRQVSPLLGDNFDTLRKDGLLDLGSRLGKGGGGYSIPLRASKRSFIFMNATGRHLDVQVLLHEAGHTFHSFATHSLPYFQQRDAGIEFRETVAIAMELLGTPYLAAAQGGFYTESEAALARLQHLERMLFLWPSIAQVDAFQHWVYENHETALDPHTCDATWAALEQRFNPAISWQGLEQEQKIGWQQKLHIHIQPFYYFEYALAQLGALQIWRNHLHNPLQAVTQYQEAMTLGGTMPLPTLYQAAGIRFAFDSDTLHTLITFVEHTIDELESQLG